MKAANIENMSDEELMELYKKGEHHVFDQIYHRYAGRILSYLRKKTGSDRNAHDLTQEVFLKLHRSREQYNKMLPLAPWVFSISSSVFLDFAKKKSLEDTTAPEKFDEFQAHEVISEENQNSEVLNTLPELQKQTVALRVFDEATFEEIATRLSTTPENARQMFSRGIRKLKSSWNGKES